MILCVYICIIIIIFFFKPTQERECWWKGLQAELIPCLCVYLELVRRNMTKGMEANAPEYRTNLTSDKRISFVSLSNHPNQVSFYHYIFDSLTHNVSYRWCVIELYTWNKCHPNKFTKIKKEITQFLRILNVIFFEKYYCLWS